MLLAISAAVPQSRLLISTAAYRLVRATTCQSILEYFRSAREGGKALLIRKRKLPRSQESCIAFEGISKSGSSPMAQWLLSRARVLEPESKEGA